MLEVFIRPEEQGRAVGSLLHGAVKCLVLICSIVFALQAPSRGEAHGGRLDGNGGHWDRKAGTYHYHRSRPSVSSVRTKEPSRSPTKPSRHRSQRQMERPRDHVKVDRKTSSGGGAETIRWTETATHRIKVKVRGGKEVGRWTFPKKLVEKSDLHAVLADGSSDVGRLSEDEVLRLLGEPGSRSTERGEDVWSYGNAQASFRQGLLVKCNGLFAIRCRAARRKETRRNSSALGR